MLEKPYLLKIDEVVEKLQTDPKNGLAHTEAIQRLHKFGPNTLKEKKGKNPFLIFLAQFQSFLILILIAAAGISFLLGESIDALMIITIVILNAVVGFIQEYKVEKTIEKLKKLMQASCMVYRDGGMHQITALELVVGDLMVLEEGQKVPADLRLTESYSLKVNEASLTGESTPVNKRIDPLVGDLIIADQKNMLFSGTNISSGKGIGIVVATGMSTEIGKIADMVEKEEEHLTPLQIKLNKLGKLIGQIVLIIAILIGLEQILLGEEFFKALISAIALAVAAIPEGLPAVVTISLALGTKRLLKQNSLIRNLAAAETLGSTDIICADKTGTLTEGVMSVREIYANETLYQVDDHSNHDLDNLEKILTIGVLASNARKSGEKILGDPTEVALIQAAVNFEIDQATLVQKYNRISEIPFSSDRKRMSVILENGDKKILASKGAAEIILERCSKIEINGQIKNLTEADKKKILATNDQMAGRALRVLAFAYREIASSPKAPRNDKTEQPILNVIASKAKQSNDSIEPISSALQNDNSEESLEKDLVFLGLQGMIDPPKEGVKEAIRICQKDAGIKVVMITGDHLLTAQSIAKDIGIEGKSISGVELDKLTDQEFEKQVEEIVVYARVNPEHKIRIVKALKSHGHQVAMTGDGVNDAAALKAADIGVAMGITGTDVAKESSDMILLDDNFTTIVSAIKEGRAIFDNIRKFVNYLLSSNIMEVLVISLAVILGGGHLPLLPIHLLWINLVTDGLPAIALGVDPPRKNIMNLPPKSFREEIVGGRFIAPLITVSVLLTIAILAIFFIYERDPSYEQTMVFTSIVFYEMIRIFAIRSEYNLGIFSNKYLILAIVGSLSLHLMILYAPIRLGSTTLQELFKVHPLNLADWALLLGVGVLLLVIMRILVINPFFKMFHKQSSLTTTT